MTAQDEARRVVITREEVRTARGDGLCHGIVTRAGVEDACMRDASLVVWDPEAALWPACVWHAHRYGGAVPLAVLEAAVATGAAWWSP